MPRRDAFHAVWSDLPSGVSGDGSAGEDEEEEESYSSDDGSEESFRIPVLRRRPDALRSRPTRVFSTVLEEDNHGRGGGGGY